MRRWHRRRNLVVTIVGTQATVLRVVSNFGNYAGRLGAILHVSGLGAMVVWEVTSFLTATILGHAVSVEVGTIIYFVVIVTALPQSALRDGSVLPWHVGI